MEKQSLWLTPFTKQCFVTSGVVFNLFDWGLVTAYTSCLLPQLRKPDSIVPIDDSLGSWIVAVSTFAMIPSSFLSPIVMGKYGRKMANILGIVPNIIGWLIIALATNFTSLLVARFLQGFALVVTTNVAPVLIGEYTSPHNRGAFLSTMMLATAIGVVSVQAMGLYLHWQLTALICAGFAFVDLLIVMYSPESPSWLIDQGRYQESRKIFRWLRGGGEEEELNKMIEENIVLRKCTRKADSFSPKSLLMKIRVNLNFYMTTIKKKEFYKPILIVIHMYNMLHWCGFHCVVAYAVDIVDNIVGNGDITPLVIISAGIQKPISCLCAVYLVKKLKRRTMLLYSSGINITVLLVTAGYTYAKACNILPCDHPYIGLLLFHLHIFSITIGPASLPFVVAGELFPLQYRSLATAICVVSGNPSLLFAIKTVPFLLKNIGLYGMYCLYAVVVSYCLAVAWVLMPETKDRTLQEIEEEFRGRRLSAVELQALNS